MEAGATQVTTTSSLALRSNRAASDDRREHSMLPFTPSKRTTRTYRGADDKGEAEAEAAVEGEPPPLPPSATAARPSAVEEGAEAEEEAVDEGVAGAEAVPPVPAVAVPASLTLTMLTRSPRCRKEKWRGLKTTSSSLNVDWWTTTRQR